MPSIPANLTIREAAHDELENLGQLLARIFVELPGFPSPEENPDYYEKLANLQSVANQPGVKVLVAATKSGEIAGGVVYFGEMAYYGAESAAASEENASGIRLLGIDPAFRGIGLGKSLAEACIDLARQAGHSQVILHTTKAMPLAWEMYERMGFVRHEAYDFVHEDLHVYGFTLKLS